MSGILPISAPRICLILLVLAFHASSSSCSEDSADVRVWTPEDHSHPEVSSDERSQPSGGRSSGEMTEEESVALLWMEACAPCHGESGRGDGPGAPADVELKDLTTPEWQASATDEAIAAIIENGREQMPGFGANAPRERRLNQLGIRALVRHVRRLGETDR